MAIRKRKEKKLWARISCTYDNGTFTLYVDGKQEVSWKPDCDKWTLQKWQSFDLTTITGSHAIKPVEPEPKEYAVPAENAKDNEPVSPLGSDCDAGAMSPPEPRPCPHCGTALQFESDPDGERYWHPKHKQCHLSMQYLWDYQLKSWNRRAADGEIARLSGERDDLLRDRDNYSQWHEENRNTINARNAEIDRLKAENERWLTAYNRAYGDLETAECELNLARHEIEEYKAENEELRCKEAGTSCANQEYKAEVEKLQAENERLQNVAGNAIQWEQEIEKVRDKLKIDLDKARKRIARVSDMVWHGIYADAWELRQDIRAALEEPTEDKCPK